MAAKNSEPLILRIIEKDAEGATELLSAPIVNAPETRAKLFQARDDLRSVVLAAK